MKKKKVLICGATGFIGRNIAETFINNADYELYGTFFNKTPWNNKKIKMIKADLTKKTDVDRAVKGKDIIIQAAAVTSGSKDIINEPFRHVTDNAVMNSLIFRSAFENKVSRMIFFSCSVMYGSSTRAVKETDFDANKEIFPAYFGAGWTKVYLEKMCEFYSRIGKTKFTVIRHSNIYGPHDKFDLERSHVFGATMTKVMKAAAGEKIVIWGKGQAGRDLMYISDLVEFVNLVLKRQKEMFSIYNAGTGKVYTIPELVNMIIAASGKILSLKYDVAKPDIRTNLHLDISKARRDLGWSPKISIKEGIDRTMAWYKTGGKK